MPHMQKYGADDNHCTVFVQFRLNFRGLNKNYSNNQEIFYIISH